MRCTVSLPELIHGMVLMVAKKYDLGLSGAIRVLIVEGFDAMKTSGKME